MAAPTETSDLGTLAATSDGTLTEADLDGTEFMAIWTGSAGSQTLGTITIANFLDHAQTDLSIALGGLSDVTETSVGNDEVLQYTGAAWENQTLAEAGIQAQGDVLDDLNTLGAASTDGEIIVATGAGAFAYESGATARTSLGAAALGANTFTGNQDLDGNNITMGGGVLDAEGGEIKAFVNDVISVDTTSADVTLSAATHGGAILLASGGATNQVIVPTTAGFTCVIIAGSAIQVEFNSTTIDTNLASGDILTVVVEDSTTIHAVKTLSASKETFS